MKRLFLILLLCGFLQSPFLALGVTQEEKTIFENEPKEITYALPKHAGLYAGSHFGFPYNNFGGLLYYHPDNKYAMGVKGNFGDYLQAEMFGRAYPKNPAFILQPYIGGGIAFWKSIKDRRGPFVRFRKGGPELLHQGAVGPVIQLGLDIPLWRVLLNGEGSVALLHDFKTGEKILAPLATIGVTVHLF